MVYLLCVLIGVAAGVVLSGFFLTKVRTIVAEELAVIEARLRGR